MRFQRIHEAVHFRPWFISVSGYESVRALLERAEKGELPAKAEGDDDWLNDFIRVRPEMEIDGNGIARICVFGVTGLHLTGLEKTCGNTDYKDIEREIGEAVGRGARGILLVVDSPGGGVTGCPECAQVISTCQIPIVVFTDTMACSAAYYLSSGARAIVATESAEVGNVGVILPWIDKSKMFDLLGLKPQPIVNEGADLKSIGREGSLSDSQRQFLQSMADQLGFQFRAHIDAHRVTDDEVWRAGWYSGQTSIDLGLVDYLGDESAAYGVLLSMIPID